MMKSELVTQIMRFGVVGSVGFIVDASLLWLFLSLGVNPYLGRLMSFPIALVTTWALNHKWTFGATHHAHRKGHFRRYLGVQLTGMSVNYMTYSLVITILGRDDFVILSALVAGSFVGMFINFCGARYIAFRV
ncbi:GtrA family protein [Yoonia sp. BS5-3]|uniref:GtrA family protein n=1 Tax=Yoonia phaeophyticola TaxID=3137369 RepID=A0ABZ2V3Q2_9RHOB